MYSILDLETTGWVNSDTEPQEPIELALLRVTEDFEVNGRFYCRWTPSIPVQPGAAKVNGYTPEAWEGWPRLCSADMERLAEFLDGAQWVGSYPEYDFRILKEQRLCCGVSEWNLSTHRKVDVGSLGLPLIKARGSAKGGLDGIVAALEALGQPVPPMPSSLASLARGRVGAHTAMGDAWRTLHAFRCLMEPAVEHWRRR